MNCITDGIHVFHDHRPCEEDSGKGMVLSMVKRAVIGLIATAAIAIGIYFAAMAMYKISNPLGFSANVQMGLSIAASSILGLSGLVMTGAVLYKTKKSYE